MKNEEMIAKYYEKVRELYLLGKNIVNHYDDDENRANIFDALTTIETMSIKCISCISDLRKEMGYTK